MTVLEDHDLVALGEAKPGARLFLKHIGIDALGTQEGDTVFERFALGANMVELGLFHLDLLLNTREIEDAVVSIDQVIAEVGGQTERHDRECEAAQKWLSCHPPLSRIVLSESEFRHRR